MRIRIGVDLGGTKIEAVALDDSGTSLCRRRIGTPQGDYVERINAIGALVAQIEQDLAMQGTVGVATPGALSPATGLIKNANSTVLNGHPLDQDLSKVLDREIRVANDANCFALSEAIDGAASDSGVVFGVILGTGTGAGIAVYKRILAGPNAIAGEWGHNPLPWPSIEEWPGPPCYCNRTGCIETFLSGPGLARDFRQASGLALAPPAIIALAEAGHSTAEHALWRYEDRMARGLAHVINVLDPDVIVLGGGMSNISRLYTNVPKLWDRYVFSDGVRTPLVAPMYGDSSGVRGAAWLWP